MSPEAFSFFWKGVLLGAHAGIAPGPVSTLIVTESLLHGRRAGMRIAFVPLLTDLPVVAVVIPLLYCLTFDADAVIGVFSMVGALILCGLGVESLRVTRDRYERGETRKVSLLRAVGVNFFNPNLYLYWFAICGPICVEALHQGPGMMFLFLAAFYGSITSVKIAVALAVGSARKTLNLAIIVWINRLLGLAMFLFAGLFFRQGWRLLIGEASLRSE